jgi:hypothetical protein
MTSIPDSVKATLDAQWTAAGGAEPTYYVSEDFRTDPPLGKDGIWIPTGTLKTRVVPVNDTYSNIFHTLDIIANTQTDEDRLKEIADEIERILNLYPITGATYQKVTDRKSNVGQYKGIWVYQEVITVDIREQLASSSSAYGANTSANYLNSLLMYGSANATYHPCVFETLNSLTKTSMSSGIITNTDATDFYMLWRLPLPCLKGTLKLYVSNIRIVLADADAGDYIDTVWVYGGKSTGGTQLYTDPTNLDSTGSKESGDELGAWGAATDCSSYDAVTVQIQAVCTNAGDLDIASVSLQCYYA